MPGEAALDGRLVLGNGLEHLDLVADVLDLTEEVGGLEDLAVLAVGLACDAEVVGPFGPLVVGEFAVEACFSESL